MKGFVFIFLLSTLGLQAQDFVAGPGKDVVEKVCTACHGPENVVSEHMVRDDWKDTVSDMVSKGADAKPDEVTIILDYLGKFYGPLVNVNHTDVKELTTQLGLTEAEANAVLQYRKDKGDYKTFADVGKVTGLDIKKLEPLKNRLRY